MKAPIRSSGALRRRQHLVEPDAEAPLVVVGRGRQHVVLAREVAVEGAPRHPGRLGDLLHAEPPDAAPADEAEGGGEDPLLGRAEVAERGGAQPRSGGDVLERHRHCRYILDTFCPFCLTCAVHGRVQAAASSGARPRRLKLAVPEPPAPDRRHDEQHDQGDQPDQRGERARGRRPPTVRR